MCNNFNTADNEICQPRQYSIILLLENGCLKFRGILYPAIPNNPYSIRDRPQKFAYTNSSNMIAKRIDPTASVAFISSNAGIRGAPTAWNKKRPTMKNGR